LLLKGPSRAASGTFQADVTHLARACAETARGVIMVGPEPAHQPDAPRALLQLAEATGFPLLCEATSQLRFHADSPGGALCVDGFEWLLRSTRLRERLRPDLLLSFGGTPTSSGYERLLNAGFQGQRFVIAAQGFPDPHGLASELICCGSADAARRTTELLTQTPPAHQAERVAFRQAWAEANRQAWVVVEEELARRQAPLSEPRAVRSLIEHLPEPCWLMLGNSLPIREVDAYVPGSGRRICVLSQRGANGIDGLLSGAAGAASVTAEPTVILLGDVSFMHDLGGLAVAREGQGPFCVVVIDNGGGRIFEQLPVFSQLRERAAERRYWLTPPDVTLEHAAKLFGYRYTRVVTDDEIPEALRRATSERVVTIVHVVVAGESAREAEVRVRTRLDSLTEPLA
jgi:2-succinyl-5-enolpyruvyl-6-hydroxy-3-cyclohexene-1-carboxylate synthase